MSADHFEEIKQEASLSHMLHLTERLIKNFSLITLLELRKANHHLVGIFISSIFILFALMGVWLSVMGVIAFALYTHHWTIPHLLILIAALQLMISLTLFFVIRLLSKTLLFPKTREAFTFLIP